MLSECHRSIDKSIDFCFFLYRERVHCNKGIQSWKFKISLQIPNHNLLSRTLNNTHLYLSKFPAKINDKIFKINNQTMFCGHFCTKGIFPKNSS